MKTRRLTTLSLLLAAALILSRVEALIPLAALPGMKIGLGNIVTLFALYRLRVRDACLLSALRVAMTSLLFGSLLSFAYSAAGAACSLLAMILLRRTGKFSPLTVSMTAGAVHNLAQVAVACIFFRQSAIFSYLPVLIPCGIVAGMAVGAAGVLLIRQIPDRWTSSVSPAEKIEKTKKKYTKENQP